MLSILLRPQALSEGSATAKAVRERVRPVNVRGKQSVGEEGGLGGGGGEEGELTDQVAEILSLTSLPGNGQTALTIWLHGGAGTLSFLRRGPLSPQLDCTRICVDGAPRFPPSLSLIAVSARLPSNSQHSKMEGLREVVARPYPFRVISLRPSASAHRGRVNRFHVARAVLCTQPQLQQLVLLSEREQLPVT